MPRAVANLLPQTHGQSNWSVSMSIVRLGFPVVIFWQPMDSLFSPPFGESREHLFFLFFVAMCFRQSGELTHRAHKSGLSQCLSGLSRMSSGLSRMSSGLFPEVNGLPMQQWKETRGERCSRESSEEKPPSGKCFGPDIS